MDERRWLLLLHQIPPKPPYFRAKVLRRLSQVGALPIKNSAYVLPDSEDALEDFEWILQEIKEQGGAAWLFRSEALAGMSAGQIEEGFRQLHSAEYQTLLQQARALLERANSGAGDVFGAGRKLSRQSEELRRIDFFKSPLREDLEQLMSEIEKHVKASDTSRLAAEPAKPGQIWVTRKGIRVDRIASAWLIRRFIDPDANFRFVDTADYTHTAGEIRFDMFEGEFTHQGDSCTFEVLVATHNLKGDLGLVAISEIVHDIDLKDDRYRREETAGVCRLIDGVCSRSSPDNLRIEHGGLIFESLYEAVG